MDTSSPGALATPHTVGAIAAKAAEAATTTIAPSMHAAARKAPIPFHTQQSHPAAYTQQQHESPYAGGPPHHQGQGYHHYQYPPPPPPHSALGGEPTLDVRRVRTYASGDTAARLYAPQASPLQQGAYGHYPAGPGSAPSSAGGSGGGSYFSPASRASGGGDYRASPYRRPSFSAMSPAAQQQQQQQPRPYEQHPPPPEGWAGGPPGYYTPYPHPPPPPGYGQQYASPRGPNMYPTPEYSPQETPRTWRNPMGMIISNPPPPPPPADSEAAGNNMSTGASYPPPQQQPQQQPGPHPRHMSAPAVPLSAARMGSNNNAAAAVAAPATGAPPGGLDPMVAAIVSVSRQTSQAGEMVMGMGQMGGGVGGPVVATPGGAVSAVSGPPGAGVPYPMEAAAYAPRASTLGETPSGWYLRERKRKSLIHRPTRPCTNCKTHTSCTWRPGPVGPGSLCNRCGYVLLFAVWRGGGVGGV